VSSRAAAVVRPDPLETALIWRALARDWRRGRARGTTWISDERVGSRSGEIVIEERGRLALVAGHEMPVAVVRDRHARVAHLRREGLRVHISGDHQRGERVATLVERNRLQRFPPSLPPSLVRACPRGRSAPRRVRRSERPVCGRSEDEPLTPPRGKSRLDHKPAEHGCDRDVAAARPGLRFEEDAGLRSYERLTRLLLRRGRCPPSAKRAVRPGEGRRTSRSAAATTRTDSIHLDSRQPARLRRLRTEHRTAPPRRQAGGGLAGALV
jgi:hypothetical protein